MKKEKPHFLFGAKPAYPHEATVKKIRKEKTEGLTDQELSRRIASLRGKGDRQKQMIEGYALIIEQIRRSTGLALFDCQIATALSLQNGRIAELPTGEGKTAAAVLASAWFALEGHKVHVLSFNDYLARRDCLFASPILKACGLSCGFITQESSREERRESYACDVVYVSAKEAGFDFLREFLCMREEDRLSPARDVAIVDEADSILLDEARIPLVIAGEAPEFAVPLVQLVEFASGLGKEAVCVDAANNQVFLTDEGISRAETELAVKNLHSSENVELLAALNTALQACFLLRCDRDYLVREGEVSIVDEGTGRIAQSRRYPDLLQAAVEAKEGVAFSRRSRIYHSTTLRDFLRLYPHLSGMTGTAKSAEGEIWNLYAVEVDEIPPHIKSIRFDREERLFVTREQRDCALRKALQEAEEQSRPVLVGTRSVAESEQLSAKLMEEGIEHCVLNARDDTREAELIAKAGLPGRVTVSTNMAGRGVDIRLGENDRQAGEQARGVGGLLVLGTGLNRCKRIQDQLRGRAGRQGDPGESVFFLSLEEERELLGFEFPENRPYSADENGEITEPWVLKLVRREQRNAQAADSEERYMLQRYAYILEQQRQVVSEWRDQVLSGEAPGCCWENGQEDLEVLVKSASEEGVKKADRQLTLYFINLHWADYLESMEAVRDGIHLNVVGGKNPLDEYHRAAIAAFEEMEGEIAADVCKTIRECEITRDGIDMEKYGMELASSTWTCLVEDSSSQFSRLRQIVKAMMAPMQKAAEQISSLGRK